MVFAPKTTTALLSSSICNAEKLLQSKLTIQNKVSIYQDSLVFEAPLNYPEALKIPLFSSFFHTFTSVLLTSKQPSLHAQSQGINPHY